MTCDTVLNAVDVDRSNEKYPYIDRKEMNMLDKIHVQTVLYMAKNFDDGGLQWTR